MHLIPISHLYRSWYTPSLPSNALATSMAVRRAEAVSKAAVPFLPSSFLLFHTFFYEQLCTRNRHSFHVFHSARERKVSSAENPCKPSIVSHRWPGGLGFFSLANQACHGFLEECRGIKSRQTRLRSRSNRCADQYFRRGNFNVYLPPPSPDRCAKLKRKLLPSLSQPLRCTDQYEKLYLTII